MDLITEVPTLADEPSDDGGGHHLLLLGGGIVLIVGLLVLIKKTAKWFKKPQGKNTIVMSLCSSFFEK